MAEGFLKATEEKWGKKSRSCFKTKDQFRPWVFALNVCFLQQGEHFLCDKDP